MLTVVIPATEAWNSKTEEFEVYPEIKLNLEHSLISVSKWESKWNKVFLTQEDKTLEETLSYIECMTLSKGIDSEMYYRMSAENLNDINKYISESMTATYFHDDGNAKGGSEQTTSELIYYWMITLNIPFECQKWHLNRLLTLIRVCNVKNTPPKKMSTRDIANRNAQLNAQRRKKYNSKG